MSIFNYKILCPYCFQEIEKREIQYQCLSGNCLENEMGMLKKHIIVKNKPDRHGYCICDQCNQVTNRKVCPQCLNVFPDNILESEVERIAIVGERASGKSYYLATLLRQLMEKALLTKIGANPDSKYKISAKWAVEQSRWEYQHRFQESMRHFFPLTPTCMVADFAKDYPPLLVETAFRKKNRSISKIYSFSDMAGESFLLESEMLPTLSCLRHSKAVILILDPQQCPKVGEKISACMSDFSKYSQITGADILSNIAQLIRVTEELECSKQIKIPLCLVISKWDLLIRVPDLLPEQLIPDVSQDSRQGYDSSRINQDSREIRNMLWKWDPALVAQAEHQFETVQYFGCSAWGFAGVKETGAPPIDPYKVEAPFLWLLHRDGFL